MIDIVDLKQELLDNTTRHFYVFTGEEIALQDIYIKQISKVSGLEIVVADNISGLLSTLTATSLFKLEPKIYVVRNDDNYDKPEKWDVLLNRKNFQDNILIIRDSIYDKSSKFYKAHDKVLTQFNLISGTHLRNRLMAITNMNATDCDELVRLCGGNYGKIRNELIKLYRYAKVLNTSLDIAFIRARKNKLIHEEIGDVIFDFTDAILTRNIKKSYELFDKVMQTDDGVAIKILSILYNSFRQVLSVQCTQPKDRTEQGLGLTSAQIYVATQKAYKYNSIELVSIVKQIRALEKGIKTGTVDANYAIPFLMGVIW